MNFSTQTDTDRQLGFTIAARHVRGQVVRLGDVLDQILSAHAYSEQIAAILAEAIVLAALFGGVLRPDDGQLTLQIKGQGGSIRLLVADYRDGQLRGYAAQDFDRRSVSGPALQALFGDAQLVLTLDQNISSERYQGIVALEGDSLHQAAEAYFATSEQLPTVVRIAAKKGPDGRWTAGGLLIQQLALGEAGASRLDADGEAADRLDDWHDMAVLAGSVAAKELVDPKLSLESLLWRLFHEQEVRVLPPRLLSKGCRCSEGHIRNVLMQFAEAERAQMADDNDIITVDCEFCARQFQIEA